jgi:hypothetical protein
MFAIDSEPRKQPCSGEIQLSARYAEMSVDLYRIEYFAGRVAFDREICAVR